MLVKHLHQGSGFGEESFRLFFYNLSAIRFTSCAAIDQWEVVCLRAMKSLSIVRVSGWDAVGAKWGGERSPAASFHFMTWSLFPIGSPAAERARVLAFSLNRDARELIRTP